MRRLQANSHLQPTKPLCEPPHCLSNIVACPQYRGTHMLHAGCVVLLICHLSIHVFFVKHKAQVLVGKTPWPIVRGVRAAPFPTTTITATLTAFFCGGALIRNIDGTSRRLLQCKLFFQQYPLVQADVSAPDRSNYTPLSQYWNKHAQAWDMRFWAVC